MILKKLTHLAYGTVNNLLYYLKNGTWTALPTGGSSYLVYTALLTQSGTDAPVATVLENTLGGTVVWTRNEIGEYVGTLIGAFTANKTIIPPFGGRNVAFQPISNSTIGYWTAFPSGSSEDNINVASFSDLEYTPVELNAIIGDGVEGFPIFLEVRVYS